MTRAPERGIACPGCPHRAAYISVKNAMGRGRGRVYCGDAGCAVAGPLPPAALTCPGGDEALLPRYRQPVPDATSPATTCAHFVTDRVLIERGTKGADTANHEFDHLPREGATVLLCILASSRASLAAETRADLAQRARELGADDVVMVDPFDTLAAEQVVVSALAAPGAHGIIFASPCVQLQRGADAEAVEVDRFACSGCHRCAQITGCPALRFTPPVYTVDQDACAGCDLCSDYCRTNVIYTPRQRLTPSERHARRVAACGAGR